MVSTQVGKFALLRQIGLYPFVDGVSQAECHDWFSDMAGTRLQGVQNEETRWQ
jgi:hypothetical protein